jgi:hypothetical protein
MLVKVAAALRPPRREGWSRQRLNLKLHSQHSRSMPKMQIGSFNPVQKSGAFPDAAQRAAFAPGSGLCAFRTMAQSCVADTRPSNRAANGSQALRSTLRAAPCPEFSKIKFGRLGTVEDLAGTVVFRDPSSRQGGRIGRHVVSGSNRCGARLVHVKEQPLVVVAAQTFHG